MDDGVAGKVDTHPAAGVSLPVEQRRREPDDRAAPRIGAEEYERLFRDLAEKALVFLGTDAGSGTVVGFSTALFYRQRHAGRRVGIYFSGDTIIHPRYWGQTALDRKSVV